MDRLAVLNVVGVGAIAMLATVAVGLGVQGLATGTVFPIPLLPQWQQLGHTTAEQLQALTAVMPVMIACYVAHQVGLLCCSSGWLARWAGCWVGVVKSAGAYLCMSSNATACRQ